MTGNKEIDIVSAIEFMRKRGLLGPNKTKFIVTFFNVDTTTEKGSITKEIDFIEVMAEFKREGGAAYFE